MLAAFTKALRNLLDGIPQGISKPGDLPRLGFGERILPFPPQEIVPDLGKLAMLFGDRRALIYRRLHQFRLIQLFEAQQDDKFCFAAAL